MTPKTKKFVLFSLGYGLVFLFIAVVLWKHPWFWITTSTIIVNLFVGSIGASLIYSKFFKRPMNLETFGIWTAIILVGPIVFLVGIFYKPRHVAY